MSNPIKNPVRDIIVPQVAGDGGGADLSSVHAGMSGVDGSYTTSTSNFATKSTIFSCSATFSLPRACVMADVVSGATYTVTVAEYVSGTITAILGVSGVFTAATTESNVWVDGVFSSPVTLNSGSVYLIALSRTDGTGTTALTWNTAGTSGPRIRVHNVAATVGDGTNVIAFFAKTALSVNDTPDFTAVGGQGGVHAIPHTRP